MRNYIRLSKTYVDELLYSYYKINNTSTPPLPGEEKKSQKLKYCKIINLMRGFGVFGS